MGESEAYNVSFGDLLDYVGLMGLGVDGAVVGDLIDLLALPTNFRDSVFLGFLKLFNDAVHDIHKDNLELNLAFVNSSPGP